MTTPESKSTAMGIYSSSQFLGAFLGGWLFGEYGAAGVFASCTVMALFWLFVAFGMKQPGNESPVPVREDIERSKTAGVAGPWIRRKQ